MKGEFAMKIFLLISWTILLSLNIFDTCTTFIILEHGGKELNWFVNWFIVKFDPAVGLFLIKTITLLVLTFASAWISNCKINLRQRIVIISSYLIAICYYSYVMYNSNYAYIKSFNV